ncbi:uncharacterized protein LOC131160194 [Malania oleifera]|uniref:uncharacterized protein LOC131160194 n=1 Tax=Malania oleifera TaxID=397392 RepID=UPI0025AE3456|nr:uncharacterized protein LOC131160194 [Malania oleifera]
MDLEEILGNNDLEDVSWLCSLSEAELDILISLKKLVLQRAKIIGGDVLANKFDLKVLRALGFIVMEYLRGQIKDMADCPDLVKFHTLLDVSNLLNCDAKGCMSFAELKECVSTKSRTRRPGM